MSDVKTDNQPQYQANPTRGKKWLITFNLKIDGVLEKTKIVVNMDCIGFFFFGNHKRLNNRYFPGL